MTDDAPSSLFTGFAKTLAGLSPAPIPQPSQVLTDRRLSVTIQGHLGAVMTADKSYLVQVPPTGCTVTAIATTDGTTGSALNIPGTQSADLHTTNVSLPLAVVPGDSLVVFNNFATANPIPAYWQAQTNSVLDEAMAVVFVPYPVAPGMFRPPAIGRRSNPLVYFLRTAEPILHSRMNTAQLPEVFTLDDVYQIPGVPRPGDADRIDPTVWDHDRPTWQTVVERMGGEVDANGNVTCGGRFAGDVYSDWNVRFRAPWTQHAGYGANYAFASSLASLFLVLGGEYRKNKELVALALCQRALDDVGRLADGAFLEHNGGHGWGRRVPITILGKLFDWQEVKDISRTLGDRVAEDVGLPYGPWWHGDPSWTVQFPFSIGQGSAWQANPPSTWGAFNDPTHVAPAWGTTYWAQKFPALLGGACALHLLECGKFAPRLMAAMRQHQKRPSAAAIAQMTAAGFPSGTPWVWDRTWGKPAKLFAKVWHNYVLGLPGIPVFN